ncbi:MAG TPA: PAS domain S-box protein, partial [candidate division Zixibacteria bacterium]|nr:PAS domain S-box protein [candidate division Zixibacteria bacterium]
MKKKDKSHEELKLEVEKLRTQLAEAEETLRAIRSGEVDALVVSGEKGEQVFTLKGAEQPYRILIEEMSEGAVMLAADDSILYCNGGFAGMLKTPLVKLMGTEIAHYIAPSDEAVFRELLRKGRERSSIGEITLLAGDGTFVPTHLSLDTLQSDDAHFVYLVATDLTGQKRIQDELRRARDELEIRVEERTAELVKANEELHIEITERKQVDEALRQAHDELEQRVRERTAELQEANKALMESEAGYRELTESIEDLFYAIDSDLKYTYWNKASEVLTGISAKDAIGKSLYELFPDIKGTKAEQFYIKALKAREPERFESQFQIGGKKFIFEINAYPTKTSLSVIAKNITEKKMFEAQLLRSQRMESIGTLAGGMAHDLNNVLTPIMLSLQMLKEKLEDEKSRKLLTILEKNSQRGADIIKQILSFSRGVEGERVPLQVKHIITEIEKVTKETFPRNIEIGTDIQNDLFTISGDVTQLHQVIMNLCLNAR